MIKNSFAKSFNVVGHDIGQAIQDARVRLLVIQSKTGSSRSMFQDLIREIICHLDLLFPFPFPNSTAPQYRAFDEDRKFLERIFEGLFTSQEKSRRL
jgi:hypothetical protein